MLEVPAEGEIVVVSMAAVTVFGIEDDDDSGPELDAADVEIELVSACTFTVDATEDGEALVDAADEVGNIEDEEVSTTVEVSGVLGTRVDAGVLDDKGMVEVLWLLVLPADVELLDKGGALELLSAALVEVIVLPTELELLGEKLLLVLLATAVVRLLVLSTEVELAVRMLAVLVTAVLV